MSAILIMLAILVVGTLLYASTLALAARWLKYPRRGFGRALLVVPLWMALSAVDFLLTMLFVDSNLAGQVSLALLGVMVVLSVGSIRWMFRASWGRSFAGWGIVMGAQLIYLVLLLVVVHQRVLGSYSSRTIAMAPTIMCKHACTVCPKCGGTVLFDLEDDQLARYRFPSYPPRPLQTEGTCLQCRQSVISRVDALVTWPADRFFVTKFLMPRRWDLAAFHHEQITLIKRVVGLPGEEISIDAQGHVSMNGQRLTSPAGVPEVFPWIVVAKGMPADYVKYIVSPEGKLHLGPDEYFVIGDHAEASSDSRMWGPVHSGEMVGVATTIYWPLSRARILR